MRALKYRTEDQAEMEQAERLTKDEEARLIERARAGDAGAFGILVSAFTPPLTARVLAHLHESRIEDAQNLVQDLWALAWEDLPKPPERRGYDPARGRYYTYLLHRFLNHLIKRHNKKMDAERAETFSLDEETGKDSETLECRIVDPQAISPAEAAKMKEELLRLREIHAELFRITFLKGGYPHEQLAFAMLKLVSGRQSHRAIEGKPADLDASHGASPLQEVAEVFWREYQKESELPLECLARCEQDLRPLREKLHMKVEAIYPPRSRLYERLSQVLGALVGLTCFHHYYDRRGASASLSDWCYKVRERVRKALGASDQDSSPEDAEARFVL